MNALRWVLGVIAVVFIGGFLALVLLANAFRKSFGASEHGPFFIGLPVAGLVVLLAAVFFPANRPLLHVAAVAALGLTGFCARQIVAKGEAPLWFALVWLAAWFVYYWLAAWRSVGPA